MTAPPSGERTFPENRPAWLSSADGEFLAARYQVTREVGRGRMGVVYRAHHATLDIPIALKIIRDADTADRFHHEARMLARVNSNYVVRVLDLEYLPSGLPFLVMDWVDGRDLAAEMHAGGGQLSESRTLPIMRDACQGMLAVERERIVHRDLEPSLTGRTPFEGDSIYSLFLKHKLEPVSSPKSRCPALSASSCEALERCLSKSPGDRYQSFDALLAHLVKDTDGTNTWTADADPRLREVLSRYRERRQSYLKPSRGQDISDTYKFPDDRELHIVTGDLARQDVVALVSSDDYELTMGGGVSLALFKAAGADLLDEAAIYVPVRPGRAVVTSAGRLPARFIFHGITLGVREGDYLVPTHDLINEIISSCLYHVETLNVTSIAFPLLGTGAGGFERQACLDIMFARLARTLVGGVTPLRSARIVLNPLASLPEALD
ncbi:MAG: serine/threonine-protein kinase [Candidatus Eisenbacteria bacterium]|nr:serine/threonine-protein kinase [Candidatus Eisenbacteria bacterium]